MILLPQYLRIYNFPTFTDYILPYSLSLVKRIAVVGSLSLLSLFSQILLTQDCHGNLSKYMALIVLLCY